MEAYWAAGKDLGPGSMFDTADRAEEYARLNASSEV